MTNSVMTEDKSPFEITIRVYIEDTDAGGIVFYANYLKFFERARTEYVRALGIHLRSGLEKNISYVVHSLDLKYLKPARLDDVIRARASLEKVARSYMVFKQSVLDVRGRVLVEGHVKVACTALDTGKPIAFDSELREALLANVVVSSV